MLRRKCVPMVDVPLESLATDQIQRERDFGIPADISQRFVTCQIRCLNALLQIPVAAVN